MKISRIVCFWSILIHSGMPLSAQKRWILKKDKDGIKISTRESNRSRFNDIKVEMDLTGNIYQLAVILKDVNRYTEWCYGTKKSMLVKITTSDNLIYYSEISAPWPASNRDLYANLKVNIDSVVHVLKVVSVGEKDYRPVKGGLVRIPYSTGVWNISTVSGNTIHVVYVLQVDPGGSVPAWILNLFSTKAPLVTFENLKNKMLALNYHN
ncbi:MAG TPA: START domain-containing protein [Puia sp.]